MRKWSLFFLISSAMLAVTYLVYGFPIMLGIMCMLAFVGLVLLDLPDTTENSRPRYASTIGPVKKSTTQRRLIQKKGSEKTDKADCTVDVKKTWQIDPVRLQLEHEAHGLLSFYVWYLLAGTRELTFGEMVEKVNRKFGRLLNKEDLSNALVSNMGLRGGPFFDCSAEGWMSKLAYYMQCTLRKRLVSLEYSFNRPSNALELVSNIERREQRIRDIQMKTLLNSRLKYRANRDSPWWSVYQFKMDREFYLARLNNLFPDKETRRIYE